MVCFSPLSKEFLCQSSFELEYMIHGTLCMRNPHYKMVYWHPYCTKELCKTRRIRTSFAQSLICHCIGPCDIAVFGYAQGMRTVSRCSSEYRYSCTLLDFGGTTIIIQCIFDDRSWHLKSAAHSFISCWKKTLVLLHAL